VGNVPSNLPSHTPPFAWPHVTHGVSRRCVRGVVPGCASPVLAIGGTHLLSLPRSRAGPVGTAQRDRVPEMPPRRLVASALICPIVKLPVRSLRCRHSHSCHLPSRSAPARCRLLHDFAHTMSRSEALTPLAPGRASAARCGRTTRSRAPVRPFLGDACDRRGTRGWGRSARPRGSPIGRARGSPTGGTENTHSGSSSRRSGGRPSHPHPEIEFPGSPLSRPFEAGLSRRRCFVEQPGVRHLSRMSCSPQSTQ
jgi:hypothetical protein